MTRDDIDRSRNIRSQILRDLSSAVRGGVAFGMQFEQFRKGLARSGVTAGELRQELADLAGDGLVAEKFDPDLGNLYRITSRGQDFLRADMPWEKIDEFSGGR